MVLTINLLIGQLYERKFFIELDASMVLQLFLCLDGINFGGEDHLLNVRLGKNFHMIQEKHVITLYSNTGKNV